MTTQTTTPIESRTEALDEQRAPSRRAMPIRRASQVLGILEPRPVSPMAAVPAGFWKTGWLPKPEGAAS
jgi:hypothetical protein